MHVMYHKVLNCAGWQKGSRDFERREMSVDWSQRGLKGEGAPLMGGWMDGWMNGEMK